VFGGETTARNHKGREAVRKSDGYSGAHGRPFASRELNGFGREEVSSGVTGVRVLRNLSRSYENFDVICHVTRVVQKSDRIEP